jgi:hypothetical protein
MRVHYLTSFIRMSTNAVPDSTPPMLRSWYLLQGAPVRSGAKSSDLGVAVDDRMI